VGCAVGPGFDFRDFEMLSKGSAMHAHITSLGATFVELV
jgi:predicted cupin superfamily sugar epimerase